MTDLRLVGFQASVSGSRRAFLSAWSPFARARQHGDHRASFADDRPRAAAIGLWSTSSGPALAAGPPLGGVIVDAVGWRGVFLFAASLAGALALAGFPLARAPGAH